MLVVCHFPFQVSIIVICHFYVFIIPFASYFISNSNVLDPAKHRGQIFVLPFYNILKNMSGLSSMQHVPLLAYVHFYGLFKMANKGKGAKYLYSKNEKKST